MRGVGVWKQLHDLDGKGDAPRRLAAAVFDLGWDLDADPEADLGLGVPGGALPADAAALRRPAAARDPLTGAWAGRGRAGVVAPPAPLADARGLAAFWADAAFFGTA